MSRQKGFYARRKDENHNQVKRAIERAGHVVFDTHKQGDGFPDLLVILKDTLLVILIEVKVPGEQLTKRELLFHARYPGLLITVYDPQDALKKIKEIQEQIL